MSTFFKNIFDFKKTTLKTRLITGLVMGFLNTFIVYLADEVFKWSDLGVDYYGFYFIWMAIFGFFFAGMTLKKNF